MRRPSEILQEARALIEDPSNWCIGTVQDKHGRMCALGAVGMVEHGSPHLASVVSPSVELLDRAAEVMLPDEPDWNHDIVYVNNDMGHAATMEAFDIAISMALSDESTDR